MQTNTRAHRLALGLTLRQLADQCEQEGTPVSHSQLARIERGESTPRPALRLTLAEMFGLSVTDFDKE